MNNLSWMAFSRSAVGAAVAIVIAAPVMAQNTTSAIGGRVVGADGAGIAGANVAILHTESGSLVNATTNADGRYLARGLRVGGPYTITFTKDGQSDKREGVFLALAETLALDTTLGAPVTTITVTGRGISDKFNRSTMGAGTSIGSRELNAQASIARNLQDYARADPRVSQTDKERGEISVAGQNSRFNSITIDGVKINDTFGLESNNLPTAKQPISIDAIQSVQVNVSNYDATQKGYTGANINAVTKSGTNEFKGSLYYVWRNDTFAGQRLNRTNYSYSPPPAFKEATTGFTLGGPIVQDKLFFFVNYEELKSSRNAPSFSPLGGSLTNVGITPTLISGVQNIARTQYGIDLGDSNVPSGVNLTVKDTLVKLDWNISDDHRASLRYTKTAQTEPIFPNFSTTQLSLSSNWYTQEKTIETLVGQWFADWTPTFSTELKYSRRDYDSVPENNARLPQMGFAVTGPTPTGTPSSVPTGTRTLYTGTEASRHFNILRTNTDDGYAAANWQLGDHELKFGADVSRNKIFNAFLQNTLGNYTFSCVNSSSTYAYSGAVPIDPTATNPGQVNCSNAAQVEAAILENFRLGRPSTYTAQVPLSGRTLEDGVAGWTLTETGLFAQDTWNLSKQLTLMAGVRVDNQTTGEKPVANANAAAAYVPGNPGTNTRASGGFGRDNTATLDGEQLVQPRFGFNYNLPTERRMQVRGGFGLFQGAAATVWLSNPFSNPGVATTTVGCTSGPTPCDPNGGVFSPNPDTQPGLSAFPGAVPAANVDFIDKGLGQPSVWKANLAFEAELPWNGIVASAEWMFTKTKQGIYYQNLNLGPVMGTGTDGRELYYNGQGLDDACWNANGSAITTGATCGGLSSRGLRNLSYNNVLLATETKKGGGNAITLALSQPARDGFSWAAAYTRTTAKEVSPLTSSTSFSNWGGRSVFNPNEEVEANSAYLVRDRWNGSLSYSQAFVDKYRTTVGLFYEGRKGKPYSWTYNNDLNGDSVSGNDLMYIPKGPGSGEVVFGGAGEAAFWNVVEQFDELKNSKGGVVKRNGSFSPFVNTFDLRLAQEMPGLFGNNKATVTFDILNVGNLLNKKWGRTDEIGFQSGGAAARSFVNYGGLDSSGRYVYNVTTLEDYATRQAKGESQWAAQITLKYEF